jgi:hypothetical protein
MCDDVLLSADSNAMFDEEINEHEFRNALQDSLEYTAVTPQKALPNYFSDCEFLGTLVDLSSSSSSEGCLPSSLQAMLLYPLLPGTLCY